MCIIVSKPENLKLADSVLKTCWENNDDGAGFMYAEDNRLHVQKGFMTYDDFYKAYEPHADKKLVIHFRIRTHGETNEANTHPFIVDDNLAFVHNGTITGFGSKEFSDTYHFNEELIKNLRQSVRNFLHVPAIETLLSERIGWSKLVFMDNKGTVRIINEEKGNYSSDGVWFSNTSWQPRKTYTKQYGGGYYFHGADTTPKKQDSMHQLCGLDDDVLVGDSILIPEPKDTLKAGDYAVCSYTFSYGGTKFHQGDVVKISWFGDGTEVSVRTLAGTVESIPVYCLESIIGESTLLAPWGHLSKGRIVYVVKSINLNTYRVVDPVLNRLYDIPKRIISVKE